MRHGTVLAARFAMRCSVARVVAAVAMTCAPRADADSGLRIGLEHRTRIEYLDHDYRAEGVDGTAALSLRTLLSVEAHRDRWFGGLELIDARVYATDGAPLNTTFVDPLDLLQAYAGLRADTFELRAGRLTIDLGSRRLVARNAFRNTINAFTGLDLSWHRGAGTLRLVTAVPVERAPSDLPGITANALALDRETFSTIMTAVHGQATTAGVTGEAYALGLHERDGDVPTRNRRLISVGVRAVRKPARGALDVDVELIGQWGTVRETTAATDTTDLDHRAWFAHLEVGGSPALALQPRIAVLYDHATGDRQAGDADSQRFDPLFGARRFELGPAGLFGVLARSNVISPGLRISLVPRTGLDVIAMHRLFWLQSGTDAWTTAGIRDVSGAAGSYVGTVTELQVRWSVMPRHLTVDVGGAILDRGTFARLAPQTREAAAAYGYAQVTVAL